MAKETDQVDDALHFLQGYFRALFSFWMQNDDLPSKFLAKADERKLGYSPTIKTVIDDDFLIALEQIEAKNHYGVVPCFGGITLLESEGERLIAFQVRFANTNLPVSSLSGFDNFRVAVRASEVYGLRGSVYKFWVVNFDDEEFEFYFDESDVLQLQKVLKNYLTQSVFFNVEAKQLWDNADKSNRYKAIGAWAAQQDVI